MKRNLSRFKEKNYDIAIIGGGIYGAWVAWDSALRGLSVALVDKGDFGSGTSSNSQKIIHGGLRYLQHGDIKRMRQSIRERRCLLRIAPHLVYPLPFLIPTYGWGFRGKALMSFALNLNDLVSLDRNYRVEPERFIPKSKMISKEECLKICPGLEKKGLTGAAVFYDAQIYNSERLIFSLLWSASNFGADLANYARVTGFLREGNTILGLRGEDCLSGKPFLIRSKAVINCSGPWINEILSSVNGLDIRRTKGKFKAMVLVTRQLFKDFAVGLPSKTQYIDRSEVIKKGFRYYFITPWRNTSLVGTYYSGFSGNPDSLEITPEEVNRFIKEINTSYPLAKLNLKDVRYVYRGLLPSGSEDGIQNDIQYEKHYQIRDHEKEEGIKGLISVSGVKFTTARGVAEDVVDMAMKKTGKKISPCKTENVLIHDGQFSGLKTYDNWTASNIPKEIKKDTIHHLIRNYGERVSVIFDIGKQKKEWFEPVSDSTHVIKAEVVFGVREECAEKLKDIIFRRTELGTTGYPGDEVLMTCAHIMGEELHWGKDRIGSEVQEVKDSFSLFGNEGIDRFS